MQKKQKTWMRLSILGTIAQGFLVLTIFAYLLIREKSAESLLLPGIAAILLIGHSTVLAVVQYRMNRRMMQEMETLAGAREEMDETMQEVIGNITHDLRTPITSIKGYSQGILDGVAATPERVAIYVTTIRNKANDMSGIVDELTFFSNISQNQLEYQFIPVVANDYLSECISELSLDLETKQIDFAYQYFAGPGLRVRMDAEKMKRVIHNIVENAAKFIAAKPGMIRICAEERGEWLVVRIQDNGTGICREDMPYIFNRFYRGDSSRNSNTGGSGLGLSIAKKIIEDHGGTIWAESERGAGTEISFSLPVYAEKEESA